MSLAFNKMGAKLTEVKGYANGFSVSVNPQLAYAGFGALA